MKERIGQLEKLHSKFGFLYNIDALEDKPTQSVLEHCMNLEEALIHNQSKNIERVELCGDIQAISRRVKKHSISNDVLDFILEEALRNLYIALRIILTLPVSVASGESSFSKFKLIKTIFRQFK